MYDNSADDRMLNHRRSRLLYEPLSLLNTLGPTRGDRIKPDTIPPHGEGFSPIQSQRSFVDAIAYICAYKKGPAYVTAAALEKDPEKIVLWLAANKGVEHAVMEFLEPVLKIISWLVDKKSANLSNKDGASALGFLARLTLRFNSSRIFSYYHEIVSLVAPDVVPMLARDPKFRGLSCLKMLFFLFFYDCLLNTSDKPGISRHPGGRQFQRMAGQSSV